MGAVRQGFGPAHPAIDSTPGQEVEVRVPDVLQDNVALHIRSECTQQLAALEGLRQALCTVCTTPDVIAAAILWARDFLARECDEVSLLSRWAHERALQWAAEHWTPHWLCGQQADDSVRVPLFRHSEQILFAMDMEDVVGAPAVLAGEGRGYFLCSRGEETRFRESDCQWDGTVIIEDVLGQGDWAGEMHWSLCGAADHTLFVASCASLKGYAVAPQGLLRYGDFVVSQALATMQQDVLLLLVQLWKRAVPFAALVPRFDAAILSALCRLPGVRKAQGVQLALLFTCGENEIPAALYHSLKLGA